MNLSNMYLGLSMAASSMLISICMALLLGPDGLTPVGKGTGPRPALPVGCVGAALPRMLEIMPPCPVGVVFVCSAALRAVLMWVGELEWPCGWPVAPGMLATGA